MKEFSCSVSRVTRLGKAGLKGLDLGIIYEIGGALVATGGGGKLAGKDSGSAGGAEDAGGMSVGKVDSAFGQLVDVWGNGPWRFAKATDPVVHVVDREEENVRTIFTREAQATREEKDYERDGNSFTCFH